MAIGEGLQNGHRGACESMPARGAHPSFMTNGNSQVTGASLQRGYFPGDGHDTRPLKPAELGCLVVRQFLCCHWAEVSARQLYGFGQFNL